MLRFKTILTALVGLLLPLLFLVPDARAVDDGPMHVSIDARDLPRKLLHATLSIPIAAESESRQVALWYPKWVPGSHGPGGPIANVAGMQFTSGDGSVLSWTRTPGEVYRILVDVPGEVTQLKVQVRYIANQPSTNSMGHDVFGSRDMGIISPGAVLFYREGSSIDDVRISGELHLPSGWQAASAMKLERPSSGSAMQFESATLRTFVDSPIMCGRHHQVFVLSDPADAETPVHRLNVFSESPDALAVNSELLSRLRGMVSQASRLMGSHPFAEFDVLLGLTDQLPANGLEHLRCSLNVLPRNALSNPQQLKGWNRLLIPHEYLHAWCGKYRRPAGMVAQDFHTPKGTDLLWVYEGLTQYLGELIEARCGLMSHDEFRHRLSVELRLASHQQGRAWRSLADTAAASHVLRAGSNSWPRLRGGQDYYMEGMLLWLEIDAILRRESAGAHSLDDFCQVFFAAQADTGLPSAYDRQEIVRQLSALLEYDWDGLIRRRVESPQESYDPAVAELLGYQLVVQSDAPHIPSHTFRYHAGVDEYDSIGCTLSNDGRVTDILLGSPADLAQLSPGCKILGVNSHSWSAAALRDAIRHTADRGKLELLVEEDGQLSTVQIQYTGGSRYLRLQPADPQQPDLLEQILQPLE